MDKDKNDEDTQKISYLRNLSEITVSTNKAVSRFHRFNAASIEEKNEELSQYVPSKWKRCMSCGHIYQPSSDKFRLLPKQRMTKKVLRLLKKYNSKNRATLGKYQLQSVKHYLNSRNVLKVTCSICGKSEKIPCQKHEERKTQREFVLSEDVKNTVQKSRKEKRKELKLKNRQRKLQSKQNTQEASLVPKTLDSSDNAADVHTAIPHLKDSTTSRHDRSISSVTQGKFPSSLTQANSNSSKKLKVQKLNKMLAEKEKKSQSSSLQDFLSSLQN